jgi:hypothetical protein
MGNTRTKHCLGKRKRWKFSLFGGVVGEMVGLEIEEEASPLRGVFLFGRQAMDSDENQNP